MKAKLQVCEAAATGLAGIGELEVPPRGKASRLAVPKSDSARVRIRPGKSELRHAVAEVRDEHRSEAQLLIALGLFAAVAACAGMADTLKLMEQWDRFVDMVRQMIG